MSVSTGDRQTLTADGQTVGRKYVGPIRVSIKGSFGSPAGTATLEDKGPDNVFDGVTNGIFTAEADKLIDYPAAEINEVRIDLTGATSPSLVVWIQGKRL